MRCFYYAMRGIIAVLQNERNMRIHFAVAFYVILAGWVCRIELVEWFVVLLCIAAVISLECINTALEAMCDAISGRYSQTIEFAKDAAAAAVLVTAAVSAIIGGIIFLNAECIYNALGFTKLYPMGAAAIVLTVPLWIKIIYMRRTKTCHKSKKAQ